MQIKTQRSYRIAGYKRTITPAWRQKLQTMGMLPGTIMNVVRVAPLGDPIHITTRRINLAVRRQDLEDLVLEEMAVCKA